MWWKLKVSAATIKRGSGSKGNPEPLLPDWKTFMLLIIIIMMLRVVRRMVTMMVIMMVVRMIIIVINMSRVVRMMMVVVVVLTRRSMEAVLKQKLSVLSRVRVCHLQCLLDSKFWPLVWWVVVTQINFYNTINWHLSRSLSEECWLQQLCSPLNKREGEGNKLEVIKFSQFFHYFEHFIGRSGGRWGYPVQVSTVQKTKAQKSKIQKTRNTLHLTFWSLDWPV